MLLNDFFSISSMETGGPEIRATLIINAGHRVFEGHFPGQPVVPGVCMMQMVKEILEKVVKREIQLSAAAEMKFLAVIDPAKNNVISASVKYSMEENGKLKVVASLFKDDLVHFRLKGTFTYLQ